MKEPRFSLYWTQHQHPNVWLHPHCPQVSYNSQVRRPHVQTEIKPSYTQFLNLIAKVPIPALERMSLFSYLLAKKLNNSLLFKTTWLWLLPFFPNWITTTIWVTLYLCNRILLTEENSSETLSSYPNYSMWVKKTTLKNTTQLGTYFQLTSSNCYEGPAEIFLVTYYSLVRPSQSFRIWMVFAI